MKENITIIDYLEKVHKANRPEDFKKLLSIQNELNRLDKRGRDLEKMLKQKIEVNRNLENKIAENESKRLSLQNNVDILENENKSLKEEVKTLINQLLEEINID